MNTQTSIQHLSNGKKSDIENGHLSFNDRTTQAIDSSNGPRYCRLPTATLWSHHFSLAKTSNIKWHHVASRKYLSDVWLLFVYNYIYTYLNMPLKSYSSISSFAKHLNLLWGLVTPWWTWIVTFRQKLHQRTLEPTKTRWPSALSQQFSSPCFLPQVFLQPSGDPCLSTVAPAFRVASSRTCTSGLRVVEISHFWIWSIPKFKVWSTVSLCIIALLILSLSSFQMMSIN